MYVVFLLLMAGLVAATDGLWSDDHVYLYPTVQWTWHCYFIWIILLVCRIMKYGKE